MPFQILRFLSAEEFRSGETIADTLGMSRASVHNAVRRAQELGIEIHSVRGRGYRLAHAYTWLEAEVLSAGLSGHDYSLHLLDEVDSTNSHLMALGLEGAGHKTVVAAEIQTGGRGRRGRSWMLPPGGGLAFSVLWRFNRTAADLSGLSLAVGLGLSHALREMGAAKAQLKWPNDILHEGRKLAGILIELQGDMLGPSQAVIGVGVNTWLSEALRAEIDQPVIDLAECIGGAVDRNRLLVACLRHLDEVLGVFEAHGFAALRSEWEASHALHGQEASIHGAQGEVWHGRVAGVDETGALLLNTDSGPKRFFSGEVSLRRATS